MCEEDKMSGAPPPVRKSIVQTARGYFELFCGVGKKVFDFLDGPGLQQMPSQLQNLIPKRTVDEDPRPLAGGKRRNSKKLKLKTQKKRRV
jgi:hypothetical protein